MTISEAHNARWGCGGGPLSVKLGQGSTSCETGEVDSFSALTTLRWGPGHNNLGACSTTNFNLDQTFMDFKLKSSSDNYCPGSLTITFDHGVTYSKTIDGYYDSDQNDLVHYAARKGNFSHL